MFREDLNITTEQKQPLRCFGYINSVPENTSIQCIYGHRTMVSDVHSLVQCVKLTTILYDILLYPEHNFIFRAFTEIINCKLHTTLTRL